MPINKILIVDDSPTERHFLAELLRGKGYQVVLAEDGDKGVACAREILPDLILMDVVMPGTNGFQATRALTRDDSTKHIPVILCTTKDQETDKVWGLRQGAQAYITKPVDQAVLLAKISELSH